MSNGLSDQVVRITLHGTKAVANPDPAPVEKDVQKVKWCADFPFTIKIASANFSSNTGTGDCQNTVTRGPFPNPSGRKERFKYSIIVNGVETDPEIEIQP